MAWLPWLHDVSQSALAAAVAVLGLVILLELRSVVHLRQSVDRSLARVFEQLDLLRFENQQLLESHAQPGSEAAPQAATTAVAAGTPRTTVPTAEVAALASGGVALAQLAERGGLPSGEARLLASLAEARARRQSERKERSPSVEAS